MMMLLVMAKFYFQIVLVAFEKTVLFRLRAKENEIFVRWQNAHLPDMILMIAAGGGVWLRVSVHPSVWASICVRACVCVCIECV